MYATQSDQLIRGNAPQFKASGQRGGMASKGIDQGPRKWLQAKRAAARSVHKGRARLEVTQDETEKKKKEKVARRRIFSIFVMLHFPALVRFSL
jgi:hypothetical protein